MRPGSDIIDAKWVNAMSTVNSSRWHKMTMRWNVDQGGRKKNSIYFSSTRPSTNCIVGDMKIQASVNTSGSKAFDSRVFTPQLFNFWRQFYVFMILCRTANLHLIVRMSLFALRLMMQYSSWAICVVVKLIDSVYIAIVLVLPRRLCSLMTEWGYSAADHVLVTVLRTICFHNGKDRNWPHVGLNALNIL